WAKVRPGSWRRRGTSASTPRSPAVRPLRSATSPSHTRPPRDTRPSPSPVTERGWTSLVAFPTESPPELVLNACFDTCILPGQEGFSRAQQPQLRAILARGPPPTRSPAFSPRDRGREPPIPRQKR